MLPQGARKTQIGSGDWLILMGTTRDHKRVAEIGGIAGQLISLSMALPSIAVEGIFRVRIIESELRDQLRRHFFFGNAVRHTDSAVYAFVENCIPLALFEITLSNLDEHFKLDDFTQEMPGALEKIWQRPYDEALLSRDGSQVISRNITCTRGLRNGRVAFYFHFYNPLKAMRWTYGEFSAPEIQVVPQRLWDLLPYTPVD